MIRFSIWKPIGIAVALMLTVGIPHESAAYQIKMKKTSGRLRIGMVEEGSLFAKAGLERNDVIREINGQAIDENTPVREVEDVIRKGGKITIERRGKIIQKNLNPQPDDQEIEPLPPGD